MSNEIKYEIKAKLGILSDSDKEYPKELNIVAWNDEPPKYDIRPWNLEHSRCYKGITLDALEARNLLVALAYEFPTEVMHVVEEMSKKGDEADA